MKIKILLIYVFIATFLTGCAAALVLETNDPKQKISDAYWLFEEKNRALPAEKLLLEAIEIYQKNQNNAGLAKAYVAYGVFLRSYAIERWQGVYKDGRGFRDKNTTYDNRYMKSIEYFEKAESLFNDNNQSNQLTNLHYNKGLSYWAASLMDQSCGSFRKSLEFNEEFRKQNPSAKVQLHNSNSLKDYIQNLLKEGNLTCNLEI